MPAILSKTEPRKYWHSSSFKMAVLFTVLLGLSAGIMLYFSYYFNRDHYIQGPSQTIDTELRYLSYADEHHNLISVLDAMKEQRARVYLLRDAHNKYLAGNLSAFPDKIFTLKEGIIVFSIDKKDFAAKVHLFDDNRILIIGIDITKAVHSYRLMQALSFASILGMATVILVSFLISTFVVSRTNRIALTAKSIMETGDLSQRIHIDARWDDLGNMAYVLNMLLERVENLMAGIRQVSDDIAHDLRTPLTRLLNNLETMRRQEIVGKDDNLQSLCDSLIQETHRLLDTFNALLRITAIETRHQRKNFSHVNLPHIIQDVIELYEPLAEEKSISIISKTEAVPMIGDRDLLFQTFANLLANAVEFTPHSGKIFIHLLKRDGRPVITIADTGPGIREEEREKVFDRFYRSDTSRSKNGNGLGLSLVAAIIALHKGKIVLKDVNPGLMVEIIF